MDKYVIGVDLGGSHAACGCVDINGNISCRCETEIDRENSAEKVINENLIPLINECKKKAEGKNIVGIGIGIPGRTDTKNGICIF